MKNKNLVILIVAGVLIFLLGIGLGMFFNKITYNTQGKSALSSKVISSVVAYGQVSGINGRVLTLNNLGEDLNIAISENAQIYTFAKDGSGQQIQQAVGFSSILVGNKVNVAVRMLVTGAVEGLSVIILP